MKQRANNKRRRRSARFRVRRSLFKKYLTFGLSIVLISFLLLGVTTYIFVQRQWEAEKRRDLTENITHIAEIITPFASYDETNHTLNLRENAHYGLTLSTISSIIGADIFVVDTTGKCKFCTESENCVHTKEMPYIVMSLTAVQDSYFEVGKLEIDGGESIYTENKYTAGVPIRGYAGGDNTIIGYCYISAPATFISGLPVTFMQIFFTAAVIMLIIIVIFVTSMSYSMSRPLKQMSGAAKKFAVGDFSVRVKVRSEDEIGELANAFNNMADSLAASEGMRRSFISNVSHELKTPMTTIAGFIDGMLDGTIPQERHRHYMKIVSIEVKRLSRLVTSMLSLSRIDRGELKISPQKFDMFSMLITILASFEQKIIARKLHITGLESFRSLTVFADPDLMYQVIYNLIENAVKFTNEGGTINFALEETSYDISVKISNTGPGIPPEDIRYIFDRFYKTDKSRSMDKKGMGLGLFIAKTIMRLHGGDIFVESRVNEYTRFTFRLPINGIQSPPKQKKSEYVETTLNSEKEE